MFDPSFRTYFLDETGRPLDIFELRERIYGGKNAPVPGYDLNGSDGLQDIYIQSFVKPALTNITTWSDNSMDRRNGKSLQTRKPLTGFRRFGR